MSIFDGDRNPLNLSFPTLGGPVFWEDLEHRGGYVLQQNKVTQHCRILDENQLYTPSETIQRARSRLGESRYSLATNNCEHFAIWCKTGIHESHQVDALLRFLTGKRLFSTIITG